MTVPAHDPILVVEGLCVQFPTPAGVVKAVDDVSFTLARGEVLGLVGEAEAGKSVTGRAVLGLIEAPGRARADRIVFDGVTSFGIEPAATRPVRGNRICLLVTDPLRAFNPVVRIDDQMIEAVRAHDDVTRPSGRARARAGLVKAGITMPDAVLAAYPHQLDADVGVRVAIAMALVNEPDVLVADEPTATLDATVAAPILQLLHTRVRESGIALLWITRDLAVAAGLADRVGVMYAGRIVEQGNCQDVLVRPAHPYTQGLLDSLPAPYAPGERLRAIPGARPAPWALPGGCAFRDRCAFADDACRVVPPVLAVGARGHAVRCVHPLLSLY